MKIDVCINLNFVSLTQNSPAVLHPSLKILYQNDAVINENGIV
ncbi:hypothetical protein [Treponema sp.]|nr:hypothetical protein [Treponema sp.]